MIGQERFQASQCLGWKAILVAAFALWAGVAHAEGSGGVARDGEVARKGGDTPPSGPCAKRPRPTPAYLETLSAEGPYGFATRDFVFVDPSRSTPPNRSFPGSPVRTLKTRVFYPVCDPQLEVSPPPENRVPVASGGPFPLLAYAHGLTSRGEPVRFMAEHLATHGYVVVAPQFPLSQGDAPGGPTIVDIPNQPGDLDFVMRQVAQLGGPDADLAAAVDTSRRGVLGLSAGGETVLIAAYHPALKIDIQSAVAHAPVACFFGAPFYSRPLPTLIVSGTADELVPPSGPERAFTLAPPPVTLVELLGGTHSGFMNRERPYVENTDTRECELLMETDPMQGQAEFVARLTAGVDPGVFEPSACLPLCGQRYEQTMGATRQIRLTRAATLAHFEATLRGRTDAAQFLTRILDRYPDVEVRTKR